MQPLSNIYLILTNRKMILENSAFLLSDIMHTEFFLRSAIQCKVFGTSSAILPKSYISNYMQFSLTKHLVCVNLREVRGVIIPRVFSFDQYTQWGGGGRDKYCILRFNGWGGSKKVVMRKILYLSKHSFRTADHALKKTYRRCMYVSLKI